jgi:hypothetical protein
MSHPSSAPIDQEPITEIPSASLYTEWVNKSKVREAILQQARFDEIKAEIAQTLRKASSCAPYKPIIRQLPTDTGHTWDRVVDCMLQLGYTMTMQPRLYSRDDCGGSWWDITPSSGR